MRRLGIVFGLAMVGIGVTGAFLAFESERAPAADPDVLIVYTSARTASIEVVAFCPPVGGIRHRSIVVPLSQLDTALADIDLVCGRVVDVEVLPRGSRRAEEDGPID